MSKPSASATTARDERERKLARLRESCAQGEVGRDRGPEHLQSGRFNPAGDEEKHDRAKGSDASAPQHIVSVGWT